MKIIEKNAKELDELLKQFCLDKNIPLRLEEFFNLFIEKKWILFDMSKDEDLFTLIDCYDKSTQWVIDKTIHINKGKLHQKQTILN